VAYQNTSCNGVAACEDLDTYPGLASGGNIMLCTLCIHIDLTVFSDMKDFEVSLCDMAIGN